MFTGIIEEMGTVAEVDVTAGGRRLRMQAKVVMEDIELGASIAHNGVCLTVTRVEDDGYWVEAVTETLSRSTLGSLWVGDRVNLERPVRLTDRLGGHMVQGHVDGIGKVTGVTAEGDATRLRVKAGPEVLRYVVEKGSITVDGVSLTVTAVDGDAFEVALIPHTLEVTTLGLRRWSDAVNLEVDIIAKYIEKLMADE
jgi:riboflavin synthase